MKPSLGLAVVAILAALVNAGAAAERSPTNALPAALLPRGPEALQRQIPALLSGAKPPPEVQQRQEAAREGLAGFEVFPPFSRS